MTEEDECFFLREYTSRAGYDFGETNNLILNLKKGMDRRGLPEWRYKERAIVQCANEMSDALRNDWLESATLVPVPPSKARDDPMYDDRIATICRRIRAGVEVDVREIVYQEGSFEADHERGEGNRRSIGEIAASYRIDKDLLAEPIEFIGIVDDVLTNGRHFQAIKRVLAERLPDVPVQGIFIARRVFPEEPNPFV
ncbi:MAG: hypothetical protein OXH94_04935 [Rhodospirillales bacterium]|nr:hypothetical protein [Rhodospirillales bacterium]